MVAIASYELEQIHGEVILRNTMCLLGLKWAFFILS